MGGDARLRQPEMSAELADRGLTGQQQVEEAQSRLVGKGLGE